MNVPLPEIINSYFNSSNAHQIESILSCFSDDAVVHDEGATLRGKSAIKGWIVKTIEKYKFQFKPLSTKNHDADVIVAVEVSGTFDGSPITLDYHFTIENNEIQSLKIE